MVKTFWVCNGISSREDGYRTEGESGLQNSIQHSSLRMIQCACIPYLGSDVGNRSWCNTGHPMNSCVTGSHSLRLLFYQTRWCEYMFISLRVRDQSTTGGKTLKEPTQTRRVLLNRPFHGFSGSYSFPAYKKMGQWSPRMIISPFLKPSLVLHLKLLAWLR